ncbi:hypothetical protein G6M70_06010 [Agrobacterium tumefaciens]|uniref:hypothetical protein n=1 Tax=Agrobacterium tumefaciens TaxID=358 RepID=UPI001573BB89|nr:hypothetical protein [Agrobacterium tumefaciens]NSZ00623.1 hypothetical protein [Agrobacterium tumefaciens]NSZ38117.1 hypothetical protein [Agrobacterium tumefaciens]NTB25636.1 hypothetical protein [Agrobacterium tumefaciens]NTB27021.1 hypothetical protein [Agrobacterium tumefaciens]NTB32353.1 hypothetical protein [Agrobacterium tumefaciens]
MSKKASIPVEHADFFFDADVGKLPTEFAVADHRKQMEYHNAGQVDPYDHLPQSLGCHVSGWMEKPAMQNSPAAVFASVFLSDLDEVETIRKGLKEICKIEGQDWAERMLKSLDLISKERNGEDN